MAVGIVVDACDVFGRPSAAVGTTSEAGPSSSLWFSCAVPTVVSILGWLAAVQLFPSLERRWARFVPAWLSWVIVISTGTSLLAGEGASAGTGAWGLLLALLGLLPRVSLQRLGLGSVLAPSGE